MTHGGREIGDTVVCTECGNRYDLARGPLDVGDIEIWHSDGDPSLKIIVDEESFVWCNHCADDIVYPNDSFKNNTDYDLPNRWRHMSPEEKSRWMTQWRVWQQAKRQDTSYGRKMQELTGDSDFRVK